MVYFYLLRMRALHFERAEDLDTDYGLFNTREAAAAALYEIVGVSRYPSLTMGVVVPGCLEFRD